MTVYGLPIAYFWRSLIVTSCSNLSAQQSDDLCHVGHALEFAYQCKRALDILFRDRFCRERYAVAKLCFEKLELDWRFGVARYAIGLVLEHVTIPRVNLDRRLRRRRVVACGMHRL